MNVETVMGTDLASLGIAELAEARDLIRGRYLPNLIATMQHPCVIGTYEQRLAAVEAEIARRGA